MTLLVARRTRDMPFHGPLAARGGFLLVWRGEIKGLVNMATPITNLSKEFPMDAALFRNAERETRRLASEGWVIKDIVEVSVEERTPKKVQ